MALSVKDLAWLGGLVEGEGCFYRQNMGKYHYPSITISMTDHDVMDKVATMWGVNLQGPYQSKRPNSKPMYKALVFNNNAVAWMLTLFPLLGKRRRAKVIELVRDWKGGSNA